MIYAIRCSATGHIKFGKARNAWRRLNTLQIGNPGPLCLIAVADWPDSEEFKIHAYLEPEWIRGEWFSRNEHAERIISYLRDGQQGLDDWRKYLRTNPRYRSPAEQTSFATSRLAKVLDYARRAETTPRAA